MKINYIKTIGFRKFQKQFETELYDVTEISGKNRSGKTNILYAIINIILGTNLSGDEKACLINNNCDSSYGELHFTDNNDKKHILIRTKNRYSGKANFLTLDGKPITQTELMSFYKDKKLFLSIINPLFFLSKKPSEQKEMIDNYLSDIKPYTIFNTLNEEQQKYLIKKYFKVSIREIYDRLSLEELSIIYSEHNLQSITGKEFLEIPKNEVKKTICNNISILKDIRYYEILTPEEQEKFINLNMLDIPKDISFNNLTELEKTILEEIPENIPEFISETNESIKKCQYDISSLNGKIEYAQNIAEQEVPKCKFFDKDIELNLARQELSFLNSDKDIVDKEKQIKIVNNLEKEILLKETEIKELENKMKTGKKKYLEIKNGLSYICPTCEQHIQDDSKLKTIENMKEDLISNFDRKNLLESQLKDLKLNLSLERCKYHSLQGDVSINKSKRISIVEENIKQLENEKLEIEKYNNEILLKEKNIQNAKLDIEKFNNSKKYYNELIDSLNKAKSLAQKFYILYIEEKIKLAKHYLKDVNIKFYSILKTTGEVKEDFIITYKGNNISDLSRSETIAAALELANMFNQISKSKFPIFIDDYESCADYDFINVYSQNTQLLISKVEKGNLLKIADFNNTNNSTIIKPIITGYKTMFINKNNVAGKKAA